MRGSASAPHEASALTLFSFRLVVGDPQESDRKVVVVEQALKTGGSTSVIDVTHLRLRFSDRYLGGRPFWGSAFAVYGEARVMTMRWAATVLAAMALLLGIASLVSAARATQRYPDHAVCMKAQPREATVSGGDRRRVGTISGYAVPEEASGC